MKRITLLTLLTLLVIKVEAQIVFTQEEIEKKKSINAVKLSEQAMYAEVVELASDDAEAVSLAQQKSINKLQNNVIEACAQRMNISKEQAKEIFDIIDDKCQNVVIKKGDMLRVFSYIAKDAVGLTRKKAKQKDIDEIFGTEELDSVAIRKNIDHALELTMGDEDSINYVVPHTAISATVQQAAQSAQEVVKQATQTLGKDVASAAQTVVVVQQPASNSIENGQSGQTIVVVQQPVSTPANTQINVVQPAVVSEPVSEVEIDVPELCQTMIDKKNMKDLMRYLNQEKRYNRLMFGNSNAMQYPEKCYIVIIDKASQKIISVLDKGYPERMNFISKKMERYSDYRDGNYAAVFVQEY